MKSEPKSEQPTNTPSATPLTAAAQAEADRLAQLESDLSIELGQVNAQMARVEASAGDELFKAKLQGQGDQVATQLANKLTTLRSRRDVLQASLARAQGERVTAAQNVERARVLERNQHAAQLRQQASDLRQQAADRQKITDALLSQLRTHEGCEYVPKVAHQLREFGEAGKLKIRELVKPQTALLLDRADRLEKRAAWLEAGGNTPIPHNMITGESLF